MSKTYTIEHSCIKVSGGRYKSTSPSAAAKKAASRLFRQSKKNLKRITFRIRETTKGSLNDMFDYAATRTLLPKPLVRVINGVEIVNKYKVTVKAVTPRGHISKTTCAASKKALAKKAKGGDCGCGK